MKGMKTPPETFFLLNNRWKIVKYKCILVQEFSKDSDNPTKYLIQKPKGFLEFSGP